ncbi:hypothetical protein HMPREF9440_00175 [Sutterella parvirubra YIT 11816]|uniref:Uncharacterized protein n=1 Tax=Sutterella parvirubra YIT 11816 TaxID=762967 RepID=H3KBS9_9BURK|nr:hypothetical protein HMPREF9440_00175 [Sutterella parvirubra YIT 11816]
MMGLVGVRARSAVRSLMRPESPGRAHASPNLSEPREKTAFASLEQDVRDEILNWGGGNARSGMRKHPS